MSKKNKVFLPSILAMAISSTLSASEVFDLKVSYYDTYDNAIARKDSIENNLRNLADAVYESTNGAHRIGKIEIYTDAGNKDNADIVWVASCWPNANISGRGRAGARIEHCDTFPNGGSPMSFLNLPRSGGYTMAHEWGHFTYALYDEYQNSSNACNPEDLGSPCKDDVGVENALMNSHWAAIGENDGVGNLNALNFSTKINNKAPDILTNAQARIYKTSGWDTLVRDPAQDPVSQNRKLYSDLMAVAPVAGEIPRIDIAKLENNAYVIDTNTQNTAREKVSFEWKRGNQGTPASTRAATDQADKVPMVKTIVIDHSANVHANQLKAVKTAVTQFIQQAEIGDIISILAFDSDVQTVSDFMPITNELSRKALIAALKAIQPTTKVPALGLALQKALADTQAAASAAPTAAQYDKDIYLFAHGFNAAGISPKDIAPKIKEANMRVFSFALNEPTEGFLRKLSEQTDGKTWLAPNLEALTNALSGLAQAASPMVDVILASDQASLSKDKGFPFYVDSTLGELDISINYSGAFDGVTFNLVDPNGTVRALTTKFPDYITIPMSAYSTVECLADEEVESKNACSASVTSPAVGEWKLQAVFANAPLNPIDISFNIKALPNENGKVFFASISTTPDLAIQNKPVLIEANVSGEGAVSGEDGAKTELPIAKLNVSGSVKKPDGNVVTLALNDNGTNGDRKANDGIYTASLTPDKLGEYAVTVKLDNKSGTGQLSSGSINYAPSPTGHIPAATTTPITDKFERVVQAQVIAKPTLQNHERVMNWAESMYPTILTALNKQEIDIPPFKVRFYPLANTYLGFNSLDSQIYIYDPDGKIFGRTDVFSVGQMSSFFSFAQQSEF